MNLQALKNPYIGLTEQGNTSTIEAIFAILWM